MVCLRLIGHDHRVTSSDRLAELAARRERVRGCLAELRHDGAVLGAILLATCNRFEVVLRTADPTGDARARAALAALGVGGADARELADDDAVQHLLRVATGLESMILGEEQIVGQLGRAFQEADELGLLDRSLHMLRTRVLAGARELRQRSGLGRSRTSIASVAANALHRAGPRLAIVGAGETGRLALEELQRLGAHDVLVVNRTLQRAESLARHFGGRAIALDAFLDGDRVTRSLDGVLLAVDSPTPLFDVPHRGALRRIVDVSQPSVVAPELLAVAATDADLDVVGLAAVGRAAETPRDGGGDPAAVDTCAKLTAARADRIWDEIHSKRADLGRVIDLHVENALAELDQAFRSQLGHLGDDDQARVRKVLLKAVRRNAHYHLQDLKGRAPTDLRTVVDEPASAEMS